MTRLAAAERRSLVSALHDAGPDRPTLCAGWTTLDLAAHVVSRERRPDSTFGLVLPPLRPWTDRVRTGYTRRPYAQLLRQIAAGPPLLGPFGLPGMDERLNLIEFFVHCEDVRRAEPGWLPRVVSPELRLELWRRLCAQRRLLFRRCPVGVVLATPQGLRQAVGQGGPHVVLTGEPTELLLYATGRSRQARVQVSGPAETVRRFREADLGGL